MVATDRRCTRTADVPKELLGEHVSDERGRVATGEALVTQQEHEALLRLTSTATRKAEDAISAYATVDADWKAAHKRMGDRLIGLGERIQDLEQCNSNLRDRLTRLESSPMDLTDSFIPTKVWVAAIGSVVALVVIILAASSSIKSDVRDSSTQYTAHIKLEDEREASRQRFNEDLKKQIELNRIQVESIRQELARMQRKD